MCSVPSKKSNVFHNGWRMQQRRAEWRRARLSGLVWSGLSDSRGRILPRFTQPWSLIPLTGELESKKLFWHVSFPENVTDPHQPSHLLTDSRVLGPQPHKQSQRSAAGKVNELVCTQTKAVTFHPKSDYPSELRGKVQIRGLPNSSQVKVLVPRVLQVLRGPA